MTLFRWRTVFALTLTTLIAAPVAAQTDAATLQSIIAAAAGREATLSAEGIVRLAWQRGDVAVIVDGMALKPPAGLGSWAAFKPAGANVVVMGDTVVFEDEITPALDAALAHGLEVTALHNHFVFDDPAVLFMHIGGSGDAAKLATGVKAMWDAITDVRQRYPTPQQRFSGGVPQAGSLDAAALEAVIGIPGSVNDGVVKFTFGRDAEINGVTVGGAMGLSTWAAFSGDQDFAAVSGDFIMAPEEVQTVLRALRAYGVHIVALHNHMTSTEPAFHFLHFWGKGPALQLAQAIRAAIDSQTGLAVE